MARGQALADFGGGNWGSIELSCNCNYWYEGTCPESGDLLRLPRTSLSEEIARCLMQLLAADPEYSREGKMYGILLVETPSGENRVLKAFSGLLNGSSDVKGWVPPIPGRDRVAVGEALALKELDAIKNELITLKQLPQRLEYETLFSEFELQWQILLDRHRKSKQERDEKRQLLCQKLDGEHLKIAWQELARASQLAGIDRKLFKRRRDEILQPLKQAIEAADARVRELKRRRKQISRQLQLQMHEAYSLLNFWGNSRSLQQLMPAGAIPTGTGDCCAPKLLNYAATNNLKPLAMAEFWWGPRSGDKIQGEFYGACGDRCQPLMGFLLSGIVRDRAGEIVKNTPVTNNALDCMMEALPVSQNSHFARISEEFMTEKMPAIESSKKINLSLKLQVIYQDKWLIAVNKNFGFLSVPGRYFDSQDSVQSRLQNILPEGLEVRAAHRLDLETSGILLLARDKETYRQMSAQFTKKRVRKVYEAVLSGSLKIDKGTIELPLRGNPENRPVQEVDLVRGKASLTHFQVISREENRTRIEFFPLTGRTHQLRVHAADARGLGMPILGDRLYGCQAAASRLHLHARELSFAHPQSGETVCLKVETPF
ncbi:MAG: pseudouridine synthase [Oscillatoriaceae cyanobacterium Prado104]|jgi:tRNA pseudouridine32 synthase/23S rRNA pseudouridine746 synthase|nr:pseudouridine synthase [Oscillatoriaceae cyanobacterium Prado104]